eukprot:1012586-Rhodomonas_salina.4
MSASVRAFAFASPVACKYHLHKLLALSPSRFPQLSEFHLVSLAFQNAGSGLPCCVCRCQGRADQTQTATAQLLPNDWGKAVAKMLTQLAV